MHKHSEVRILPFTAQQMYDLVLDIEKYPEFLPWCNALQIVSYTDTVITAQMCVGFKGITERFISQVTYDNTDYNILVKYIDGPFKFLNNQWIFTEHKNGCTVDFHIAFAFKSRILDKLITPLFSGAVEKMVQAFEHRAGVLYR